MLVSPRSHVLDFALTVEDVDVERSGRRILDSVSTGFERGRVTAIVGPSGAGKTTLINVINGLVVPRRGGVRTPEIGALVEATQWARLRRATSTIFQDNSLIGRLSALDNVLLGLAETRHPLSLAPWSSSARERAARSLRDVRLLDRAFERVEKLSGGERQRVGVARALVKNPRVLLGDEPFSSLDPLLARQLGENLRSLATRDGVTVLLVLHQTSLARALADRIVGVNAGHIVFDGPVELFDEETEAAIFAGAARGALT
ncbi:phosphonate ABC transporter ATP-binding protein [Methylocystis bryophila]|uniref:Phosphonate ABC transporter ATP-binding protein n=2 Tax=Methylocystis bryophila TaxID=655015 RepID=A0A1W6N0V5_9HYPH|nr:phosphonate ABC transporter ATP-binding protein [Methylocystis bryophila]